MVHRHRIHYEMWCRCVIVVITILSSKVVHNERLSVFLSSDSRDVALLRTIFNFQFSIFNYYMYLCPR